MDVGRGAGWLGPDDGMEIARAEFELMTSILRSGGRVIIGTDRAYHVGSPIIRVEAGTLILLRRATRSEFVEHAPNRALAEGRAPFYYEVVEHEIQ